MNNDLTTLLNDSGAERNGMIAIANNGINAVDQFKNLAGDFDIFLNQIIPQTEPQAFGRRAAIRAAHDRSKASASNTSAILPYSAGQQAQPMVVPRQNSAKLTTVAYMNLIKRFETVKNGGVPISTFYQPSLELISILASEDTDGTHTGHELRKDRDPYGRNQETDPRQREDRIQV